MVESLGGVMFDPIVSSGYSGFLHQKTDFFIIISPPCMTLAVAEAFTPTKPTNQAGAREPGGGGKGAIAPPTFCLNGMDMPVPPP